MRCIDREFAGDFFDLVFCFGNTLVHLTDINDISGFIKSCGRVLKKKGKLLIQILNYDHILGDNITDLPLIETDEIKFERSYSGTDSGLINFNTSLIIKKENRTIRNSIKLYPLRKKELDGLLSEAGFTATEYYSGFDKSGFKNGSLPLMVKSEK